MPQGYVPQGYVLQGYGHEGHAQQAHTPQGYVPRGYSPQSYGTQVFAVPGHTPPGHMQQGHMPHAYAQQGGLPQYVHQVPTHNAASQYHSAQWPQAQGHSSGHQHGGNIPSGGWYHIPPRAQGYAVQSGAQPVETGLQGWPGQPGGNTGPASAVGGSSQLWNPLQHNASVLQPQLAGGQQYAGHNVAQPNLQGQHYGHAGTHGAAPFVQQAGPDNAAPCSAAKPIDDMFSGMKIRQ